MQWEGVNKSLVTQWSDREVTSLLNSHHKHNPGQLCLFTLWSLCCPTEPNVKDEPQTSDSPYLVISVLSVRHPPLTHLKSAKRMRGKQRPRSAHPQKHSSPCTPPPRMRPSSWLQTTHTTTHWNKYSSRKCRPSGLGHTSIASKAQRLLVPPHLHGFPFQVSHNQTFQSVTGNPEWMSEALWQGLVGLCSSQCARC